MGMFDNVICRRPLPGNVPTFIQSSHPFQSKSMGCLMDTYEIREDSPLGGSDLWVKHYYENAVKGLEPVLDFTGVIEFYTNNICASGPGLYTRNGEDAQSVTYRATFVNSKLFEIKELENKSEPALKSRNFLEDFPKLSEAEYAKIKERENESLMGRTIYVLYGGRDKGYLATVVAESPKQLCTSRAETGELEVIHRSSRDSIFFDSEADAFAHRDARKAAWEKRQQEYDDRTKEWEAARKKDKQE